MHQGRDEGTAQEAAPSRNLSDVAFALDALRESMDLSVPELAHRADMDADHLWSLVNGEPMPASVAARLGLAMANVLLAREIEPAVA